MLAENNVRTGFLEREQLDAIVKRLPTYLHAPLEFMFATGWRKSEILDLTVSQVDANAGTVRLEPGTTKSGKARTIVLMPDLLDIVQKQLASIEALKKRDVICPYVFHTPDGSQIKSLRKRWETAREKAGYPTALLHDFRRSAARNLGRAGLSRSTAMQITGHATESIFNRYDIKDEAVMREAAEKMQGWAEAQRGAKKPSTPRKGQLRRVSAR
jgi:integrase